MGQAALSNDELYYTDMPVGEILRRTRLHYGQSIADVEKTLRIRAIQIEAIESGTTENLPGRVYAIGFVRSYSEYLGLDGAKMVHLFKMQSGGKTIKPELHFPAAASESKVPPFWMVGVALAAAVLIIIGWWMLQDNDRSLVSEVPDVPVTMKLDARPKTVASAVNTGEDYNVPADPAAIQPASGDQTATAAPKAAADGIILNIVENSWVEIRDKTGKAVVSRVLQAGDQYYVPDAPDLSMSLGNSGGVAISVQGQKLAALGEKGQVRRNIPLDIQYLKKNFAVSSNTTSNSVENTTR